MPCFSKFYCITTSGKLGKRLRVKQVCLQGNDGPLRVPTPDTDNISGEFTSEEFATTLQLLKPGKAPGLDHLYPELILHAAPTVKSWLKDYFPPAVCTACVSKESGEEPLWLQSLSEGSPRWIQRAIVPSLCYVSLLRSSRESSMPMSN